MKKIKIFCSWSLELDIEYEKQIELYVDVFPDSSVPEDTIRFVLMNEPPEIQNLTQAAINFKDNYNYLLTHNQDLLDEIPHSINFGCGDTWISNYDFPEKKFSVSTIVGSKRMTSNHVLRHELWMRQLEIEIPTDFFRSMHEPVLASIKNNKILLDDKSPLFDSQFHVVIENATRMNYFTEKLIDCLMTKTIPIYIGCLNIGNWFDLNGFFQASNIDEVINVCNSLNDTTYKNMIQSVERNYELAQEFRTKKERLEKLINKIVKS